MAFEQRSYSGKLFRPAPEVHIEEDGTFGVIATPWGNRQAATKVIETLRDFVLSARQDMEATSPFQKLSCLSSLANNLRVGIMLANDSIYRDENKTEYTAGVEVLVFSHVEGELAYAQVGYPQLLLARTGMPWTPLSVQVDFATEFSRASSLLPPLPQNVIGLHTTSNLSISSIKTQPGDRLVFLSHSAVCSPLFNVNSEKVQLDSISSAISKEFPESPFWLGIMDLNTAA